MLCSSSPCQLEREGKILFVIFARRILLSVGIVKSEKERKGMKILNFKFYSTVKGV